MHRQACADPCTSVLQFMQTTVSNALKYLVRAVGHRGCVHDPAASFHNLRLCSQAADECALRGGDSSDWRICLQQAPSCRMTNARMLRDLYVAPNARHA